MSDRCVDPEQLDEADISQHKEEAPAHQKPAKQVRLSPDGCTLASVGLDGTLLLRNSEHLRSFTSMIGFDSYAGCNLVCFSPDSRTVFTVSGVLVIAWKVPSNFLLSEYTPAAKSYLPQGGFIIPCEDSADEPQEKSYYIELAAIKKPVDGSVTERNTGAIHEDLRARIKQLMQARQTIVDQNNAAAEGDEKLTLDELLVNVEERDRLMAGGQSTGHCTSRTDQRGELGQRFDHREAQEGVLGCYGVPRHHT